MLNLKSTKEKIMRDFMQEQKNRANTLLNKQVKHVTEPKVFDDMKVIEVDGIYCLCEHKSGVCVWVEQSLLKEI